MSETRSDSGRRLSEALRHWRSRVSPEEAGVDLLVRRRGRGLRREDIAMLAGISLTWYARFESGTEVRLSPTLLERIAAVLRLSAKESVELFALALPEFGRSVDTLLRQVENDARLAKLARRLPSSSTVAEAEELAMSSLPAIDAAGLGRHVSWLDNSGALTFLTARGPKSSALLALGSVPFGDFPSDIHVVENVATLDEVGREFFRPLTIDSTLCVCATRSRSGSLWIGYTSSEPHAFDESEQTYIKAVSALLGMILREYEPMG
jgi:transcriptional regulator with XRE-family HTH domain